MVGRNEDEELSTMRDTVRLVLEIAKSCKTIEEFIEKLENYLKG